VEEEEEGGQSDKSGGITRPDLVLESDNGREMKEGKNLKTRVLHSQLAGFLIQVSLDPRIKGSIPN
jgi:hypothetical protein